MRLKFALSICLLMAAAQLMSGCQPNPIEDLPPAEPAPQPVAQKAVVPDPNIEPGPKAAPRPGVQVSSLPLPKGSSGKRAPALSSVPPAPPVAPLAEPPETISLDLKTLTAKLAKTDALGAMTKLAVHNQIDDLVAAMRAYHAGNRSPSLASLRERYTLLMMRVSSLLKEHDPALYVQMREGGPSLWDQLSDPQKFATL